MSTVKCPSCGQEIEVAGPVEKKTGLWWGIGCLIAAVSMAIIIPVIGLLAAIAIPSFVKARSVTQQRACVTNMQLIDNAKQQVAVADALQPGAPVPEREVAELIGGGLESHPCPRGGQYSIGPVGQDPECSVHGPMSNPRERGGPDVRAP